MSETSCGAAPASGSRRRFNLADLLASTRFAVVVVLILIIACVVGTVLPQEGQVDQYLQKYPEKAQQMAILGTLGLTHVFSAAWFIVLLCTLSLSLVMCSQRRFSAIIRTHGSLRGRAAASLILHTSILIILAGAVIRAAWGEKGYVQFREGQSVSEFMSDKGPRPLPYAIRLEKFEIDTYTENELRGGLKKANPEADFGALLVRWPATELNDRFPAQPDTVHVLRAGGEPEDSTNVVRIRVVRYVPDFVMDTASRQVVSRSPLPRNPAIQVEVEGAAGSGSMWLFALHPEFKMRAGGGHDGAPVALDMRYQHKGSIRESAPIKSFRSTVAILEKDAPAPVIRKLEVNSPLSYKGYRFYQSGYNERDPSWTSLQVVRDPGVVVVYAGFALTMIGLVMLFYVYPLGTPVGPSAASVSERKPEGAAATDGPAAVQEGGIHDSGIQS